MRKLLLILLAFIAVFTYVREHFDPQSGQLGATHQEELQVELVNVELEVEIKEAGSL